MKYDTYIRFFVVILFLQLSGSLFAQEECIDCHSDDTLTMERMGKEVSLFVHADKFAASVHGGVECTDCHQDFDAEEMPHLAGSNIAKVNCSNCHDGYQEQVDNDIHHRLGDKVGNRAPNCMTCHGTHYIMPPSEVKNKGKEFCGKCHESVNFNGKYHTTQYLSDNNCAECHEVEGFSENLTRSVHDGLVCADCHIYEVNNFDLHQEGVPNISKATCSGCHKAEFEIHKESIHGVSLAEGIDEAAACWSCHGSHLIQPVNKPGSGLFNGELVNTCGQCHNNKEFVEKFNLSVEGVSDLYALSVHGQYNEKSGSGAASCTSCHGAHNIKTRTQEGSTISAYNIPNTCSTCHEEIAKDYEESIHWIQAKKGVRHSPVCNDCHSEHSIHAVNGEFKKEEIKKLQEETCLVCHQDPKLLAKYSIEGAALEYQDSYHGLAVMRGDEDAAMCVDCHNVHKILPKKNPESSVNKANVLKTCQKCHPEANEKFAVSYSHISDSEEARFIEGIVENVYFWMVVVVIGGMFLHNLLIVVYEARKRRKKEKQSITIPRFTKNEVIQHILLLTSFILLAITGFALKYPASFWAEGLRFLGLDETIRQNMHRISAVVMIVLSFYHAFYLVLTKRGRDVLANMIPKLSDIRQAADTVLYYLRIIKTKPKYGKYDYTEKAEYWALIWGTIVMGVTGLVLWFPTIVGDWAPVWFIKVNEIIHFYEAILASLAILVWHWFFVIFHPNEYPMNFTWIDGRMSLKGYRHHHDLHFREVLLAWKKHKDGKMERKDFKHSTELFVSTFEKNNINPDDVFENELKNDPELREWLINNL
ncbi:MAG: cytochrome c3 family protein [Bacteroidetes bacterium]|nr:cytochrome c3 family protein [Bacteroidota bacterium]